MMKAPPAQLEEYTVCAVNYGANSRKEPALSLEATDVERGAAFLRKFIDKLAPPPAVAALLVRRVTVFPA